MSNAKPIARRKSHSDFLRINPNKLHGEWRELPSLYAEQSRKLARQKKTFRKCKAALRVAKLNAARRIRKYPAKYGLSGVRLTKAITDEIVQNIESVKTAADAVDELLFDIEAQRAVVKALDFKREALKDLVRMHLSGWFSESSDEEIGAAEASTAYSARKQARRARLGTSRRR